MFSITKIIVSTRRVQHFTHLPGLATLLSALLLQVLALYLIGTLAGAELGNEPGRVIAALFVGAAFDLVRFSLFILVFSVVMVVVFSWINPHAPMAPLFNAITRPFLRPLRRVIPLLGRFDLSPLVLLVLLVRSASLT